MFVSSCLEAIASARLLGTCYRLVRVVSMALLSMSSTHIFAPFGYAQTTRTVFSRCRLLHGCRLTCVLRGLLTLAGACFCHRAIYTYS